MSIYLKLFGIFFKIGLFTIGGGYAMIPLIENEIVTKRQWIKKEEFLDLLAISQTAPGVMAINIAIFISAFFLIRQHNVKRMFAYHSIAHMGVIAFGLGVGGAIGLFAALFHCAAHSFTKALAFCSTGNIAKIYGTKDMTKMGSMIRIAPLTAVLFGNAIKHNVAIGQPPGGGNHLEPAKAAIGQATAHL
jgi:formate hydrogenlyase subunit 3/multisubunit Na+/H+ antiporter MnhD subunit